MKYTWIQPSSINSKAFSSGKYACQGRFSGPCVGGLGVAGRVSSTLQGDPVTLHDGRLLGGDECSAGSMLNCDLKLCKQI